MAILPPLAHHRLAVAHDGEAGIHVLAGRRWQHWRPCDSVNSAADLPGVDARAQHNIHCGVHTPTQGEQTRAAGEREAMNRRCSRWDLWRARAVCWRPHIPGKRRAPGLRTDGLAR
eukprot:COSAG01_NODE_927_length_12693_cov_16.333810_4_plen_116_part_00